MLYVFYEPPKEYVFSFEAWDEAIAINLKKSKEEMETKLKQIEYDEIKLTEEQECKLFNVKARIEGECIYCEEKKDIYSRGLCRKCFNLLKRCNLLPTNYEKHKNNRASKSEFSKVRLEILERDNYKCVECGSIHMLNVHHIKERCQGGDNSKENLETLCYECHMEKHKGEPVYNLMKKRLLNEELNPKNK